jgi:hypothetical protein
MPIAIHLVILISLNLVYHFITSTFFRESGEVHASSQVVLIIGIAYTIYFLLVPLVKAEDNAFREDSWKSKAIRRGILYFFPVTFLYYIYKLFFQTTLTGADDDPRSVNKKLVKFTLFIAILTGIVKVGTYRPLYLDLIKEVPSEYKAKQFLAPMTLFWDLPATPFLDEVMTYWRDRSDMQILESGVKAGLVNCSSVKKFKHRSTLEDLFRVRAYLTGIFYKKFYESYAQLVHQCFKEDESFERDIVLLDSLLIFLKTQKERSTDLEEIMRAALAPFHIQERFLYYPKVVQPDLKSLIKGSIELKTLQRRLMALDMTNRDEKFVGRLKQINKDVESFWNENVAYFNTIKKYKSVYWLYYKDHTEITEAFWKIHLVKKLSDYVSRTTTELLDFITLINDMEPEYEKFDAKYYAPTTEQLKLIDSILFTLPRTVKKDVESKLKGIFIIENLGSSGLTLPILNEAGEEVAAAIFLDKKVFDMDINQHRSYVAQSFWPKELSDKIKVNISDKELSGVYTILLHEIGHVFGMGNKHQPAGLMSSTYDYESFDSEFAQFSWENAKLHRYPLDSPKLRIYSWGKFLKDKASIDVIEKAYVSLNKSLYPTLYASADRGEDFAESFVIYYLTQVLDLEYQVELLIDGRWQKVLDHNQRFNKNKNFRKKIDFFNKI